MNVLFLDIDGVLNNTASRSDVRCRFHHVLTFLDRPLEKSDLDIDDVNMRLIINLINRYHFKVVITSLWRFGAKVEWFQRLFELYGLSLPVERLDMITLLDYECDDGMRSRFIEEYVLHNNCKTFICVDDTPEHYDRYLDRLVVTQMHTGFTLEHFKKCVDIMEKLR